MGDDGSLGGPQLAERGGGDVVQVFLVRPDVVARAAEEPAEGGLGQPMDERQTGVMLHGKEPIGHGDKTAARDAAELAEKETLLLRASHGLIRIFEGCKARNRFVQSTLECTHLLLKALLQVVRGFQAAVAEPILRRLIPDFIQLLLQLFEIRCPREALVDERLKQAGYTANDIRWVTNSHLHFDHAGRNNAWAGATQLVRAREFQYASARVTRPSGFLAGDLAGITPSEWDYDDSYDILGDGSLTLISTPGHTPAHQALLVTFADRTRFALTGDAAYSLAGIHTATPTGRVWNHDAAVATLERLRSMAIDGVTMLTAHDIGQWAGVTDIAEMHSA